MEKPDVTPILVINNRQYQHVKTRVYAPVSVYKDADTFLVLAQRTF